MPHEVIMPALGMAQETGLIVSWIKQPGDAVKAGEPLMEVETDKATMEVEAQADGYLTDLRYEAGQEVPVGQVIALISETAEGSGSAQAQIAETPVQSRPAERKADETPTTPAPAPEVPAPAAAASLSGRILASPKARRLAAQQGLDLARLATAGHPQPYHVADLEVLRGLAAASAPPTARPAQTGQICARVPRSGSEAFIAWAKTEGVALDRGRLWAAFAAAALRSANDVPEILTVELSSPGLPARALANPDRAALSSPLEASAGDGIALRLRDLTDSTITAIRTGIGDTVALSVAADGDNLALTLDFDPSQLPEAAAICLITEFAARLADPRRHLL